MTNQSDTHLPRLEIAVDQRVRVYFDHGAILDSIDAVITRRRGTILTLRTPDAARLDSAGYCIVSLDGDGVGWRARARIEDAGGFIARVRLTGPICPVERRLYARAHVICRVLLSRLGPGEEPGARGQLSVIDADARWVLEEVILSPAGMRAPLCGNWAIGDRAVVRVHVPGPRGGEHIVVSGEVVQVFDEDEQELAFRFLNVDAEVQLRIGDIVDHVLLSDFLSEADDFDSDGRLF